MLAKAQKINKGTKAEQKKKDANPKKWIIIIYYTKYIYIMLLNADSEYSHLFKIIMLGDSGVGKTNILSRFTRNEFNLDTKPTIGIEFSVKNIALADKIVKM